MSNMQELCSYYQSYKANRHHPSDPVSIVKASRAWWRYLFIQQHLVVEIESRAGIFSDRDTAFEGHEAPEGRPKHPSQWWEGFTEDFFNDAAWGEFKNMQWTSFVTFDFFIWTGISFVNLKYSLNLENIVWGFILSSIDCHNMEVLPCPILCDSTSIKPTFCWSCTLSRADPFIVLHHQLMPSRLSFGGNLFCVKLYFMLLNWLPRYGSRNKWRWKNYWYARCTQADATSEGHRSISTADHINNNNNTLYATILYEASFIHL